MKTNKRVLLNNTIAQAPGYIVSDMDGEKVMLCINKGRYYNLGEVGGKIWGIIDNSKPITEIIISLMSEYEIDQTECETQVVSFLNSLLDEGLIEIQ
jgi:hypothetical protein